MSNRSAVAQKAFELAEPIVSEMGFDLVDCEYKKEGTARFLRIYIDKRGGIQIDECERVSKALDIVFDEKLTSDHDYFEVSSPGLFRPLKSKADYRRHEGEEIEISLYKNEDGKKKYLGKIKEVKEQSVIIEENGGSEREFIYTQIASCKRVFAFS